MKIPIITAAAILALGPSSNASAQETNLSNILEAASIMTCLPKKDCEVNSGKPTTPKPDIPKQ